MRASQHTHQGQDGFFALHVGGMDIFWGRQALGCHGIYYARFLSALHEGMINLPGMPEQLRCLFHKFITSRVAARL